PPQKATEFAGYGDVSGSGIGFTPVGDAVIDRHGSAFYSASVPAGSTTDYAIHNDLNNSTRIVYEHGKITSFSDNGAIAIFTADFAKAFGSYSELPGGARLNSGTSQVGFIRGITPSRCTIVIWDQFLTGALTIDKCWRNFWFRGKPSGFTSETVLQGASNAGVMAWGGDTIFFETGGLRCTVQICSIFDQIYGLGGFVGTLPSPATQFTSFADGYETGGANMDYASNCQNPTDIRVLDSASFISHGWRSHFSSSYSTNGHEMIYVITVDVAGQPAPIYNRTSALALFGTPPPLGDIGRPVESIYRTDPFPRIQPKQETVFNQGTTPASIPVVISPFCSSYPME
ncbi:MAG: hypothetical protein C5B59_17190, partial [Bacteroidetes bacterium]